MQGFFYITMYLKRNLEGQKKTSPLETKSSNQEVPSQEENSNTDVNEGI